MIFDTSALIGWLPVDGSRMPASLSTPESLTLELTGVRALNAFLGSGGRFFASKTLVRGEYLNPMGNLRPDQIAEMRGLPVVDVKMVLEARERLVGNLERKKLLIDEQAISSHGGPGYHDVLVGTYRVFSGRKISENDAHLLTLGVMETMANGRAKIVTGDHPLVGNWSYLLQTRPALRSLRCVKRRSPALYGRFHF